MEYCLDLIVIVITLRIMVKIVKVLMNVSFLLSMRWEIVRRVYYN